MNPSNERSETAEVPGADPHPEMARTDPRRKPSRRPYKIRGPETWALIRESYLAGASARQVAARYDVTEWAVWRKKDRVGPPPPPALERLTPEAGAGAGGGVSDADAASLSREALNGVARALGQGRLDEARRLGLLAVSLGRLGEAAGKDAGGGYTLNDMVRMVFDLNYRTEVMRVDHDREPDEDKALYWRLNLESYEADGRRQVELKTAGWREGRAELRAVLGLAAEDETEREAVYRFYGGRVYRRKGAAAS